VENKIKLVVVDDHPLVRESMTMLLATEASFAVVASCADADAAYEAVKKHHPDVVLMDI
jgi:DNA-binding NarL/FixJ family response regulator